MAGEHGKTETKDIKSYSEPYSHTQSHAPGLKTSSAWVLHPSMQVLYFIVSGVLLCPSFDIIVSN